MGFRSRAIDVADSQYYCRQVHWYYPNQDCIHNVYDASVDSDLSKFCSAEYSLLQNGSVTKGYFSTLCCWEAVVHTLDQSWNKMKVKIW